MNGGEKLMKYRLKAGIVEGKVAPTGELILCPNGKEYAMPASLAQAIFEPVVEKTIKATPKPSPEHKFPLTDKEREALCVPAGKVK